MIGRRLFVLLACLFVVMIGFEITLPMLPFYVERLAQAKGVTQRAMVIHVALLTAAYPLDQLVFAPVWGRWSDRRGRRPLLLMGIAGYVIAQILFGLATSLWRLYVARILGGILSSAPLPVSAAYVADATTEGERGRGMAWLGTAASLGFVVGVFARDKGIDYCENSRRATYVQQEYAIRNPREFAGYGQHFWGLTASDGPGWTTQRVRGIERLFFDYVAP